jgi:hypothetical protein
MIIAIIYGFRILIGDRFSNKFKQYVAEAFVFELVIELLVLTFYNFLSNG